MTLRQLFRPRYGEYFHVTPDHWWNPKDRKIARLAAQLADFHAPAINGDIRRRVVHRALYGGGYSVCSRCGYREGSLLGDSHRGCQHQWAAC